MRNFQHLDDVSAITIHFTINDNKINCMTGTANIQLEGSSIGPTEGEGQYRARELNISHTAQPREVLNY